MRLYWSLEQVGRPDRSVITFNYKRWTDGPFTGVGLAGIVSTLSGAKEVWPR